MQPSRAWLLAALILPAVSVTADEPVRENGIVCTVVVHSAATVHGGPDESSQVIAELEPGEIRYVFQGEDGQAERVVDGVAWRRIGRRHDAADGWVKADCVYLWQTRLALEPRRHPDLVFRLSATDENFQPLVLPNGDLAVYEHSGATGRHAIAPILEPREDENDPYRVCFFVLDDLAPFAASPIGPNTSPGIVLEFVFVIDTTPGMAPLLDGVKVMMTQTVERLPATSAFAGGEVPLRFGLVEYQDATPGLTPARIAIPLTSPAEFAEQLSDIEVATNSSGEWEEDVLAGLSLSLTDEVGWSEYSAKNVILIGDASALPERDPKNSTDLMYEDLFAQARGMPGSASAAEQRETFDFHAIHGLSDAGMADHEKCEREFQTVARAGSAEGYFAQVDVDDPEQIAAAMDDLGAQYLQAALTVVDLTVAPAGPLLRGVWIRLGGRHGPSEPFPLGLAYEIDEKDRAVANLVILVRREELEEFVSLLGFLRTQLDDFVDRDSREEAAAFLESLQLALAELHIGQDIDASTPLSDILPFIPCRSNTLGYTARTLSQLEDAAYQTWINNLRATEELLQAYVDDEGAWDSLGEDGDLVRFLRLDELP